MLSNRLILIFLGIIFFLIVILTSNRISATLQERFGGFIPGLRPPTQEEITPTPTLSEEAEMFPTQTPTTTPETTAIPMENRGEEKGGPPIDKIPATGPFQLALLLLGGLLGVGVTLRKITKLKDSFTPPLSQ